MSANNHTDHSETTRRLVNITDPGEFERLATAVLRQASSGLYGNLTHPGMNPGGKPVKSPVDGIAFVSGANPPHIVIAHHTAGVVVPLRQKWLHDPSTVTPRRGTRPTAPPGDILKTMTIVAEERSRTPNLHVTLALTATTEPSEDLTRDVADAARRYRITIDIWSGARIADYLDNNPDGQWLRRNHLGIVEQRLSKPLLRELSRISLESLPLMAKLDTLIERELEKIVETRLSRPVGFLVGESGSGKTTACYRYLRAYLEAGGCGLVLTHETLLECRTLDQALETELRRLYPSLEPGAGATAHSLCTSNQPFLLLVEDVSRSSQPALLLERLAGWVPTQSGTTRNGGENWRLLCPVWPQKLAAMGDEARKRIEPLCVFATRFTPAEGRVAVERRAILAGQSLSPLQADQIAQALGYDPLLIGLWDLSSQPRAEQVIGNFVTSSLRRLASQAGSSTLSDCKSALMTVSRAMLQRRCIDPTWEAIRILFENQPDQLSAMRQIVNNGEVLSLSERVGVERLAFRHDRVRASLLTEAALALMKSDRMEDDLLAEPFFAEEIGNALAEDEAAAETVERVWALNPLALFHALKAFGNAQTPGRQAVSEAINRWLTKESSHGRANQSLRWAALQALAQTESAQVLDIVSRFREQPWPALEARFRNGDLRAGLNLCIPIEPGVSAPWLDRQIAHAKLRFGATLVQDLGALLRRSYLDGDALSGALRLAGHIGSTVLAESIEAAWQRDPGRIERLADYLWAAAECCSDDAGRFLGPVCDAWASLSSESSKEGMPSPRDDLAAYHISWAFNESLPSPALQYFVEQSRRPELRWPITYMLRGVDQPDALEFIARELASISRKLEGTDGFSFFSGNVLRDWKRRQTETGQGMSETSRQKLRELWDSPDNDKHLRQQAFRLWAATSAPDDVNLLHSMEQVAYLADDVLRARLERGDHTAIAALRERLRADTHGGWWQLGRDIWSEDLTVALDENFQRRAGKVERTWGAESQNDWIISEMMMRLPSSDAERLLENHWEHLQFSASFIQTALYIATHGSVALARETLSQCPNPGEMFEHISMHFGWKTFGHPGIEQIRRLEVLIPYFDLISESDIHRFWECCNEHGWFDFRRAHLDHRLRGQWRDIAQLDDEKVFADLDGYVDRQQTYWIGSWLDRRLSQGEQWSRILSLLIAWLGKRQTIPALQLVTMAILHAGSRADLKVLQIDGIEPLGDAKAILEDACYALRLRSLQ
jgi:hypothetical protein